MRHIAIITTIALFAASCGDEAAVWKNRDSKNEKDLSLHHRDPAVATPPAEDGGDNPAKIWVPVGIVGGAVLITASVLMYKRWQKNRTEQQPGTEGGEGETDTQETGEGDGEKVKNPTDGESKTNAQGTPGDGKPVVDAGTTNDGTLNVRRHFMQTMDFDKPYNPYDVDVRRTRPDTKFGFDPRFKIDVDTPTRVKRVSTFDSKIRRR